MKRAPVYFLLLAAVTDDWSGKEVDVFLNPCQYVYDEVQEMDWDLYRYGNLARMERSLRD